MTGNQGLSSLPINFRPKSSQISLVEVTLEMYSEIRQSDKDINRPFDSPFML